MVFIDTLVKRWHHWRTGKYWYASWQ